MTRVPHQQIRAALHLRGEKGEISADTLRDLLGEIAEGYSLNAAARRRRLSWRHAWGVVTAAAEILGAPLLESSVGGRGGGGSRLSADGRTVYREMQSMTRAVALAIRESEEPSADATSHVAAAPMILVAATMESVETGLLDATARAFLRKSGIHLGYVAAGSGVALDLARSGRIDLTLTHAPELESRFVTDGWGEERIPLMRSRFVIVGPENDPARVRATIDEGDPLEAFRRIANAGNRSETSFITRGDRSGTHIRERALWKAVGIEPGPPWYHKSRESGNGVLLEDAIALGAYTLVDRATVLRRSPGPGLAVLYRDRDDAKESVLEDVFSLVRLRKGISGSPAYRYAGEFLTWLNQYKEEVVRTGAVDAQGVALFEPFI